MWNQNESVVRRKKYSQVRGKRTGGTKGNGCLGNGFTVGGQQGSV